MTDALLAAAHDYRKRGWRVIQLHNVGPRNGTGEHFCSCNRGANCTSPGKHPVDVAWQDTEPYSAADVQSLWEKRPRANVGLAVGAASGFWVLDIDPKGGGFETMAKLVAEHGRLPDTFVVGTGSGGYHYYFALPEGIELRNSQGRVGPGIDTRADGGQVVAAPSSTDKGDYTVISDLPIAPAPDWLVQLAKKDEVAHEIVTAEALPKPEDIDPAEWARLNGYAEKAIESERQKLRQLALDGWSGAPWNATTHAVSCNLIEFANSPWNSYSLGQAQHDVMTLTPRDNEGFDDYTVTKTFNSARETVGQKARPMPERREPRSVASDPLFGGPDVKRSHPDPTEGGEGQTSPAVGGSWSRFFSAKDLLINVLAEAIMAEGPLAWGRDEIFWSFEHGVWVPSPHIVEQRCVRLLGPTYRNGHARNVETVVRHSIMYLSGDPVSRWINFTNGMLDWHTGELIGHDANLKSTVQLGTHYDPDAECPHFDAFLGEVMHPDYVELAWEMLGYLMYSGNPLQVAFMFYGSGANGKGTLMRVIQALLGPANVASESLDDLNGNRFSAVNLFGRIANLAGDIDGTYQESTANFKKLTGEDTYPGERKFGQRFNFESWAVPVFSANKIPGSADVTEGYLRRWVVLHFHKRIQNAVPGLSDLLVSELPGIARKAVAALVPLMLRKGFAPHGEALKGKQEFAQAIDQVRQWLASGGPQASPEGSCPLITLYAAYGMWAERSGQHKVREQEFSHRLEAIGFRSGSSPEGVMSHFGITVPPPNQLVAPTERKF